MQKETEKLISKLLGIVIGFLINAYILYYFWPLTMVALFHLPVINYTQSMMLLVVAHILFMRGRHE